MVLGTTHYQLDKMPKPADTAGTMFARFTTLLVLTAITLQGVFGSLQGSVIICLGGGHEHAPSEVVSHCDLACSHHSDWPTPAASDEHLDDCDCTDFELGLIVLLTTPRLADHDIVLGASALALALPPSDLLGVVHVRGPPRAYWSDPGGSPGGAERMAIIRSTRLLV
jgi:hypothetical protein